MLNLHKNNNPSIRHLFLSAFCFLLLQNLAAQNCGNTCEFNLQLNTDQQTGTHVFQATDNITSTAIISGTANVDYHAASFIELNEGFEVQAGATFHAYIEDCIPEASPLEVLLAGLRSNLDSALQAQSDGDGWPAPVCDGYLFVTESVQLTSLAGDHNNWTPESMTADAGFFWHFENVAAGTHYKYTNGTIWQADPWSRSYEYDENGEMSLVVPGFAHLERYFNVTDGNVVSRRLRLYVPAEPVTHVMYMQDGQNLFDPTALWGGWNLQESVPAGMMVVGIDNTSERFNEYTHVVDDIGVSPTGGGDVYADFVQLHVRPKIEAQYGVPSRTGVMGSSLGGLISFHIAWRFPGAFDFAGSMSGTMGWGSIVSNNETMIERYALAGHQSTALYLDSGGNGSCYDNDGDGIEDDDPNGSDNYCENRQLEQVLYGAGYVAGVDVWHWWEPNAGHNELEWGARVFRPLGIFLAL